MGMMSVGFALKRLGKFPDQLSKSLAQISVNVTIPCLLFGNIINCNQDYSSAACPNVLDSITSGWPLFVWPLFVVTCGVLLARFVVLPFGNVPTNFRKTALVAVTFGNSTGLTITLLSAIHHSFNPRTHPLGKWDPTLFLSVYLLLYPLLQWGIGGYLIGMYQDKGRDSNIDGDLLNKASHNPSGNRESLPYGPIMPINDDCVQAHRDEERTPLLSGSTNQEPAQSSPKYPIRTNIPSDTILTTTSASKDTQGDAMLVIVTDMAASSDLPSTTAAAPRVRTRPLKSFLMIVRQQVLQPPVSSLGEDCIWS